MSITKGRKGEWPGISPLLAGCAVLKRFSAGSLLPKSSEVTAIFFGVVLGINDDRITGATAAALVLPKHFFFDQVLDVARGRVLRDLGQLRPF